MASKVEKLDNMTGRLTIEVEAKEFKEAMEKAYNKQRKRFTIPGFRKGKAPFPMVVNYYGEGVFYEDAIDSLLDPHYKAAIEEHDIEPFSRPDVDIIEIGLDQGMTFTADYALKPEVKLGNYKGITAYRPDSTVEEDEITQELDAKRFELSRLVPVEDRAVQEDDHVLIDYEGSVDGVPFEGGQAEDYTLEIGSGSFIPGFEDQVIGHKAGEEFDIDVTFPEEYHNEEMAGKEAVFHIKLHEIKERQIPELDDEFIKDISEDCDTVEEYRKQVRAQMEEQRNNSADAEFLNYILDQVMEKTEYQISDRIVHDEAHRLLDRQKHYMMYQGIPFDMYLQVTGQTEQQMLMGLEDQARIEVQRGLTLEAIADAEKIEASDADLEEEITKMAESYKMEVDELKEQLGEGFENDFKDQIRLTKAGEFLRKNSEASDELPDEDIDLDLEDEKESLESEESEE